MPQNQRLPKPAHEAPQDGGCDQGKLVAALMDSRRYPHAVRRVRLAETHISWVFLAGRYAYKIKKAVDLGFLDFTSLASRHFYCEEEIRLNRRLAPKIYLDVVPIGGTAETPEFGTLPAIEYALRMRRFPVSNQLDKLAARGKLMPQHMDNLAATIANFHGNLVPAEPGSAFGSAAAIHSAAFHIFDRLRTLLANSEDAARVAALRHASEGEYANRKEHFERRHTQGFVRECHGDLHLGNIVLINEQPIPFDCIEFDPALRWIDVMNDIAFTFMDLLHWKFPELAYRFLNAYLEANGDYEGAGLLRFYIAYRAKVRAMVNAIHANQPGLPDNAKVKALANCRSFLTLAAECLAQHRPALIITHGLPGSGKSTFAQAALERLKAIRIRSDVERKRLFGLSPLADSRSHPASIYSAEATRLTYGRLHEMARELLTAGVPVIVDAAFLKQEERDYFRQLAQELAVPFAIASLQSSPATLRARIMQRQAASNDASEADLAVLEKLEKDQQVLSSQERGCAVEFINDTNPIADDVHAWNKLNRLLSAGR
jgi:aminoglycoside phosphotransferase family enzyme/predicted kinase